MALQIRRGPTADRMSYTPVVGELVWDTSTNSLYIGNGSTAGGLPAGTLVTEDVQDIASSMLINGTHQNITFTYDDTLGRINSTFDLSTFNGTLTADGFIGSHYANDSTLLLNAVTGAVNLNGTVKGHVIPFTNIAYDLGSASNRFRDLYLSGSSIKLGDATITATGAAVNLPAGSTINGSVIGTGTGAGVEAGMNYNINIVGDDSTVIINARTRAITAAGGFTGNLTGAVVGNVTGNTAGTHTGAVVGSVTGNTAGTHTGAVVGNVTGNVTGNVITNLISSADSSAIVFDTPTSFQASISVDDNITLDGGTLEIQTNEIDDNIIFASHANSSLSGSLLFRRSRGTRTVPQAVQTNDRLHQLTFNAYDGAAYRTVASIQAQVLGTVSSGIVPTGLRFLTRDILGQEVESFRINEYANLDFFTGLNLTASTASIGGMNIYGATGQQNLSVLKLYNFHTATNDACNLQFARARGVRDAEIIVQNGDPIYDIVFTGWDGTQYSNAGGIRVVVANTPGVGVVPGRVDIRAVNNSGTNGSRVQVDAYKTVFNNMPVLPTFANETAATAAVNATLTNGMMYYDTALAKVRAVAGGVWINLH